ncbi:MAG: GTA-gp10 family protein [Dehalococcoidia bacterium]|nr:GTA-gp10 family protein [Dehalococcoidia bacterium]
MSGPANARGVVVAEVAGVSRRLRLSLEAIAEIEVEIGQPFSAIALAMNDERTARWGWILTVFCAMTAAGGTPLTDADRADLIPEDLPAMLEAVQRAGEASGATEEAGPEKKATAPRPKRPGGGGRK